MATSSFDPYNPPHLSMSFPGVPCRTRSISSPAQMTPGGGSKWISPVLLTPPDSPDEDEDEEAAPPHRRPIRRFATFEFGFIPLIAGPESDDTRQERCYEELEEVPEIHAPCIKLKDGRELRPLLKHRKRSASHHVPNSGRWNSPRGSPLSTSSLSASSDSDRSSPEREHAHVHFSETLENVCVFDESAPAHDADPTHSPLDPPRAQPAPQTPSPRVKTRQLRLPDTVIASPVHKAALGFSCSENSPSTPRPISPLSPGQNMQLVLATDSILPSATNAPADAILSTLGVGLSPSRDALTGVVRVRNIAYEKRICVLYTADNWSTRHEANAHWTNAYRTGGKSRSKIDISPCPNGYDDFEFNLPLGDLGIRGDVGSAVRARSLQFAVRYQVPDHGEWWDSRDGQNWTARFRAVSTGL
ncbi:hypothetical protein CTheo_315 [Ceratobasidium theobromae]|uniref:CBM21 domain-containing protein n=1 Tax=Ceratobasidium theobromae TaxID=1582974 RepID=A0A5N5QX67_9AGAM|nr:hypothetical protein CTheo_315 [Ceratobasidium theobromae]